MDTGKLVAVAVILAAMPTLAAAQQVDNQISTGRIGPENRVAYTVLDVFPDRVQMAIGTKTRGEVAEERAAEYVSAVQNEDVQSSQRALNQLNDVAVRASVEPSQNNSERLQNAISVVTDVRSRAPAAAQDGLSNALDNLEQAKRRSDNAAVPR